MKLLLASDGYFKKLHIFGTQFNLFLRKKNGFVDQEFVVWGIYEPEIFALMKRLASHEKVFVDIGANIGQYTNFCAKNYGSVIAFEPIRDIYEQNLSSVEKNSLKNVQLFNLALGDETKESIIYHQKNNAGSSSLYQEFSHDSIPEKITVVRGDDIIQSTVHMVKIDVEGYELNVLQGLSNTITLYHPDIIMELSPIFYNHLSPDLTSRILRFLSDRNYTIYKIGYDLQVMNMHDLNDQCNIYCTYSFQ